MKPKKYRIIYLDDEIGNLKTFQLVFRREYSIFITESADTALNYIVQNEVDLIITDQRMPVMSGVEFLKRVKELKPFRPPCRIILSGYSKNKNIELAIKEYDVSMFVSKPWKPEDLKLKMDRVIEDSIMQ